MLTGPIPINRKVRTLFRRRSECTPRQRPSLAALTHRIALFKASHVCVRRQDSRQPPPPPLRSSPDHPPSRLVPPPPWLLPASQVACTRAARASREQWRWALAWRCSQARLASVPGPPAGAEARSSAARSRPGWGACGLELEVPERRPSLCGLAGPTPSPRCAASGHLEVSFNFFRRIDVNLRTGSMVPCPFRVWFCAI